MYGRPWGKLTNENRRSWMDTEVIKIPKVSGPRKVQQIRREMKLTYIIWAILPNFVKKFCPGNFVKKKAGVFTGRYFQTFSKILEIGPPSDEDRRKCTVIGTDGNSWTFLI